MENNYNNYNNNYSQRNKKNNDSILPAIFLILLIGIGIFFAFSDKLNLFNKNNNDDVNNSTIDINNSNNNNNNNNSNNNSNSNNNNNNNSNNNSNNNNNNNSNNNNSNNGNNNIDVESISLNKSSLILEKGSSATLMVTINPSNATKKMITWSSSNPNIAQVDSNGKVTGISKGSVVITAKSSNSKTASCNVTVNYTESIKPTLCDNLKNKDTIDYKDFISLREEISSGKYDDYNAIKEAHDCANKLNKKIVVTKGIYNIYRKVDSGTITVQTNTNLNGSTIYIHDEILALNSDKKANYDGTIYKIAPDSEECKGRAISKYNSVNNIVNLITNELKYNYAFVRIINKEGTTNATKVNNVFRRSGGNQNDGNPKAESFRVKNGKILDKFVWNKSDYNKNNINTVLVCKIPGNQLVFENGTFRTIISTSSKLKDVKGYVRRNISIVRSNTKLNNIKHVYVTNQNESNPSKETLAVNSYYRYTGFYSFANIADVTFSNSVVYALNGDNSNTGNSTYDLNLNHVVNMNISNVKMYNDNQLTAALWGVTGTNHTKSITYNNCKLNRIDAHEGTTDLTIKNTTVGKHAITVTGAGYTNNNKLTIDNVTVISPSKDNLIYLRGDYGSTWNGNINISNSTIKPRSGVTTIYLVYWAASVKDNKVHNYGYDLWLPDLKVNNLKINSTSTNKMYIFNKSKTFYNNLTMQKGYTSTDIYKMHFDPSITKSNITNTNNNLVIKNYNE